MYKNCFLHRRDNDYDHFVVHLWTDEGYTIEQFRNYAYQECSEHQATHRGLKGEYLKKTTNWYRGSRRNS